MTDSVIRHIELGQWGIVATGRAIGRLSRWRIVMVGHARTLLFSILGILLADRIFSTLSFEFLSWLFTHNNAPFIPVPECNMTA